MNQEPPVAERRVRLGALEAQVMDVLWDRGELTIRQIIAELPSNPAYTTIATVLRNLENKELVQSRRQGRFVLHAPRITRHEHAATAMDHALAASGDRQTSILHFVENLSVQDRELLRRYLEQQDGAEERPTRDHRVDGGVTVRRGVDDGLQANRGAQVDEVGAP